jgi:hypothetical protein
MQHVRSSGRMPMSRASGVILPPGDSEKLCVEDEGGTPFVEIMAREKEGSIRNASAGQEEYKDMKAGTEDTSVCTNHSFRRS